MERWEIIFTLFTYCPNIDRYKCVPCGKLYKSQRGIWAHIENSHNEEVLDRRDKSTIATLNINH